MFNNILKNISPVVKNILLINVVFYVLFCPAEKVEKG